MSRKLMILASAGSGKTYQLVHRIIGLLGCGIAGERVDPKKLVALTFTRKAAGEFADAVVMRLALAVLDRRVKDEVEKVVGGEVDVGGVLREVVEVLPVLQLGTIDGFFARIVRAFQYELGVGGGTFELIEGPRLKAEVGGILEDLLKDWVGSEGGEEFFHAFRRTLKGRETVGVMGPMEEFVGRWHGRWKASSGVADWGRSEGFGSLPEVEDWEKERVMRLAELRELSPHAEVTKVVDELDLHRVGSGRFAEVAKKAVLGRILEQYGEEGEVVIEYRRKPVGLGIRGSRKWRELIGLLLGCELAAACRRTRAIGELMALFDRECEWRLRRKGLLGFDDIKVLMGNWARSEEAWAQREWINFRLDGRYEHWLLDEFQDTSPAEWLGLQPLFDESTGRNDGEERGSLFVVGDRKQAIYGWRGGDVRLFEVVRSRYSRPEPVALGTMPTSRRSCRAVLELVNAVCGDLAVIGRIFGERMAQEWPWEEHASALGVTRGQAMVEVYGGARDEDALVERVLERMKRMGVGKRAMSCGVLVRNNAQVRKWAAILREEGYEVIEEGRRKPAEEHPVGVAVVQMFRWMADPASSEAWGALEMSPLGARLAECWGEEWWSRWEGMTSEVARRGYAGLLRRVLEPMWAGMGAYGRRRAEDLLEALMECDMRGMGAMSEVVRWLEDLELAQSPGAAAVQVMTIHKSKGLGFDVVLLPEVDDGKVPDRGDFRVAEGRHEEGEWLMDVPPAWVRDLVPELARAEEEWGEMQKYEMMCLWYVALTRAKRGLYVYLPAIPPSRKEPDLLGSAANWIRETAGEGFESGDEGWWEEIEEREAVESGEEAGELGQAVPRRARLVATGGGKVLAGRGSAGAREAGRRFHRQMEGVGWLDEGDGKVMADWMVDEGVRRWLSRRGRRMELWKEQAVEALVEGAWMSGVMDRLQIERDEKGAVVVVEVIDFKTDRVDAVEVLVERHGEQMRRYGMVMEEMYPGVPVRLVLVSPILRCAVEV